MKPYSYTTVGQAPPGPGVYAWYSPPRFYEVDLARLDGSLSQARTQAEREELLGAFLAKYLFAAFREAPYSARVWGKLKPKYEGALNHAAGPSSELVRALAKNPSAVREIGVILSQTAPLFASPIYIGMAKSLRIRLQRHKKLMNHYMETGSDVLASDDDEIARDHSFAWEAVVQRELDPMVLTVYCLEVTSPSIRVAYIENILNRLYYPLCGRN